MNSTIQTKKGAVKRMVIALTILTAITLSLFLYDSLTFGQVVQINTSSIGIQYPAGLYKSTREDLEMHQYIITLVNDKYNLYKEFAVNKDLSDYIYSLVNAYQNR